MSTSFSMALVLSAAPLATCKQSCRVTVHATLSSQERECPLRVVAQRQAKLGRQYPSIITLLNTQWSATATTTGTDRHLLSGSIPVAGRKSPAVCCEGLLQWTFALDRCIMMCKASAQDTGARSQRSASTASPLQATRAPSSLTRQRRPQAPTKVSHDQCASRVQPVQRPSSSATQCSTHMGTVCTESMKNFSGGTDKTADPPPFPALVSLHQVAHVPHPQSTDSMQSNVSL